MPKGWLPGCQADKQARLRSPQNNKLLQYRNRETVAWVQLEPGDTHLAVGRSLHFLFAAVPHAAHLDTPPKSLQCAVS